MYNITSGFFKANTKQLNKQLFALVAFFFATQMGLGQVTLPHYDGLDYTVGQSLSVQTTGGWILNQAATTPDLLITEGSLLYSGLATSTGNKVGFIGGGEDAIKPFTTYNTASLATVYSSYLMNITNATVLGANNGYLAGFVRAADVAGSPGTAPGSGSILAPVWVRQSVNPGFFNIGFSARANQTTVGSLPTNLQFNTTDYPLNTPVLIVMSYQFIAGSANDVAKVWINPTPGAPEPAFNYSATSTSDQADVSGFFIRQNGSTSTPGSEIDEIRIGLTWASVTPAGPIIASPPVLTADTSLNTVDYDIDITFTDDASWRAAVTAVKIGSTTLTPGTDYDLTAGNLRLKPSGLNALLTVSGSKIISVLASGYFNSLVTQVINVGVPTINSTASSSVPLALSTTSIVTIIARDQFGNRVPGYVFFYDTVITNTGATSESYTIDGTLTTSSANDVPVIAVTNATGTATFSIALPAFIDGNDGISVQVQLNDGSTIIGTPFSYIQIPTESVVNLKLFVEGYYTGSSAMTPVKNNQDGVSSLTDVTDITVELRDASFPHDVLHTTTAVLQTNGNAVCTFSSAPTGSFYIAVKAGNMVQTWSANPETVGSTQLDYDFSTAANKAYGDNMVEIEPGVFAFYSGDINQDEAIDNSDGVDLTNDIDNSEFGVKVTDLNGDGAVDNSDATFHDNNATNSIFSFHP